MEIRIKQLTKKYGDVQALNGVDMVLDKGIYGLLGPNGAGKSTLMNIMVGNMEQTSGTILCSDTDIRKMGKKYRKLLGYMPQQQNLYPYFTGWDFLAYMAALKEIPAKKAKEMICWAAKRVNLEEKMNKKIRTYSGGMKQRLLIASAILGNPEILILDEPTAGLDPRERIRIRNLISSLANNKIVIIATHVVSDVECISKEIILLKKGQVLDKAPIHEMTEKIKEYVYEIEALPENVEEIQSKYRVSNILSNGKKSFYRVISEYPPNGYQSKTVMPTLEDVYLYHFDEVERDGGGK